MPTLSIPDSLRMAAWDEFVRLLSTDDELGNLGLTIRAWDGGTGDADADADEVAIQAPTVNQMPFLQLSPAGGRQYRSATGELAIPFMVHCDLFTAGYDVRDSMNLWELIETVILSDGFQAAMRAVGVTSVTPAEAAFGVRAHYPKFEPVVPGSILGIGMIEVEMYREA